MLLHVIDALSALPLERIVVVVGHGAERVTKTLQEQLATELPVEFVEQRRAARHRRGRERRARPRAHSTISTPRTTSSSCPGDTPLLRPRRSPRSRPQHRVSDAAATVLTTRARPTPPATAACCATRTAASTASSSTPTRSTKSARSTRSTRRSTASAATCSRRRCAGSAPRTRRASTTSPMRSRCCAARVTTCTRVEADPAEVLGVNDRGAARDGRGRAARPHQRRAGCARA